MPNTHDKDLELLADQTQRVAELEAQLQAQQRASVDPRMVALKGTRIKVDDEHEYTLWELLEYWETQGNDS